MLPLSPRDTYGCLRELWKAVGTFFCSLQLPTSSLVYQTSSCISITNRNIENVFNFVNNKFDFDAYACIQFFIYLNSDLSLSLLKKQSLHHSVFSCWFSFLQETIDNLSHSWRWRLPKTAQFSAQSHQQDFAPWESQETDFPGFLWQPDWRDFRSVCPAISQSPHAREKQVL